MAVTASPFRPSLARRNYVFEQTDVTVDGTKRLSCQAPAASTRRRIRRQQRLATLSDSASSLESDCSAGFWGASRSKKRVSFNSKVQIRSFSADNSKSEPATPNSPRSHGEMDQIMDDEEENTSTSASAYEQQQRQLDFSYIRILKNIGTPYQSVETEKSTLDRKSKPFESRSPASKVAEWTDMVQDYWTPRGLESYCDAEYNSDRRKSRLQYTLSVILLQARYGAAGFQKHKVWLELARQTASITRKSHRQAHRQGLLDELAVHCDLSDGTLGKLREFKRDKASHAKQLHTTLQEMAYKQV